MPTDIEAQGLLIVGCVCAAKKLLVEFDGGKQAEMMVLDGKWTEYQSKNGYGLVYNFFGHRCG